MNSEIFETKIEDLKVLKGGLRQNNYIDHATPSCINYFKNENLPKKRQKARN
jgi:hypothetical protein